MEKWLYITSGVNNMKIDDVKRIIAENKIKMDFIRINDNYLIPGIYYLYYDDSSLNWAAFHYDREYNADRFFITEDAACRRFLELIFSSPENFEDYSLKNYWAIKERGEKLIKKYLENSIS
ncbi:hypothetical protein [Treponema sp. Marseille-Q4130]|uniref:hypothetical protein n=1 Tax=Treponema sp. Marseille-Q4130 TaxID=2766702 RepID=UPI001652093A|nr:hypothetical protein [Treponema sp. Marseille-Q4130]MBC6719228.1 hypothetical protein [Treponema sp. Marseille-Q4130]